MSLQVRDKLSEERRGLSEVIREEFAERLVVMEEENKRMKVEVAEVRARLRLEVERLSREKEEELAEVHQRLEEHRHGDEEQMLLFTTLAVIHDFTA